MKLLFCALALLSTSLFAQQRIDFIVSASPGGPNDTVTRKIVEQLEKKINTEFVVINKPGAAHTIAYGYINTTNRPTLLLSTPEITNHIAYEGLTELYNVGYFHNILVVSQKSEFNSINDLSRKKEIIFGHGGFGTYSYMAMKSVCEKKLRCLDIPYKSGAEGMMAVMAENIDVYAVVSYGSKQYIENSRIKPIANVKLDKNKSWFKLFGKNISKEDAEAITSVLHSMNASFYVDMGFEK